MASTNEKLREAYSERKVMALCLIELARLSRAVLDYGTQGHAQALRAFLDSYGGLIIAAEEAEKTRRLQIAERYEARRQEKLRLKAERAQRAAEKKTLREERRKRPTVDQWIARHPAPPEGTVQ